MHGRAPALDYAPRLIRCRGPGPRRPPRGSHAPGRCCRCGRAEWIVVAVAGRCSDGYAPACLGGGQAGSGAATGCLAGCHWDKVRCLSIDSLEQPRGEAVPGSLCAGGEGILRGRGVSLRPRTDAQPSSGATQGHTSGSGAAATSESRAMARLPDRATQPAPAIARPQPRPPALKIRSSLASEAVAGGQRGSARRGVGQSPPTPRMAGARACVRNACFATTPLFAVFFPTAPHDDNKMPDPLGRRHCEHIVSLCRPAVCMYHLCILWPCACIRSSRHRLAMRDACGDGWLLRHLGSCAIRTLVAIHPVRSFPTAALGGMAMP